jgi:hypothetical protein
LLADISPVRSRPSVDNTMAAHLFLDYGLIVLVPFYLQAASIFELTDCLTFQASTSHSFRPVLHNINYLEPGIHIAASIHFAVLASLILLLWYVYVCHAVPVSKFEPQWANEWHVASSSPHCWITAPRGNDTADIEAFKLPVNAQELVQRSIQ